MLMPYCFRRHAAITPEPLFIIAALLSYMLSLILRRLLRRYFADAHAAFFITPRFRPCAAMLMLHTLFSLFR